ncbi:MAG: VWA domain-containing protein [Planctomycetota bacterium]
MNDIQIGDESQIRWAWSILVCAVVMAFAAWSRRRALSRLVTANLRPNWVPASGVWRRVVGSVVVLLAIGLLVTALLDIRWGKVARKVPQKGIEVVFVLDVSRSMLATDASPNRLARAKQMILDTVDSMAGDRVGLVAFAGTARVLSPVTRHHSAFRQALQDADTNSVEMGGSKLGEAIRVASEAFLTKVNDHKAMILITDGEDQQSDPVGMARLVRDQQGIRIFTIGLGDMDLGSRIPVNTRTRRGYLRYQGEPVWSRLDGETLSAIALASDGAYIPAGVKRVDMANVYSTFIASVGQQEFGEAQIDAYEARFQWFLGTALALTVLYTWLTSGQPRRTPL